MTVEADSYHIRRMRSDKLARTDSSAPGEIEIVDFLSPAKVLIACNIEDTEGTALITNPRGIRACLFESEEDSDGTKVTLYREGGTKIEISGQEKLVLTHTREKRMTEIFHEKDDDFQENEAPRVGDSVNV